MRLSVSKEKVENVVKPPSTPTKIAKRTSSETVTRSSSKKDKNPISNEPKTLTNKVPYGKEASNQCADCV